jgi:hypothetical protein
LVGKSAAGQVVVEGLPTLIQACPQGGMGWVGLPEERLSRHRLMSALNDGVIGRTTLAGEAHLHSQREQPQMQPRGERGRRRIIVEDGAMVQGQRFWQAIRQERSGASANW